MKTLKVESFAPSVVMPDGTTYTPAGWMWVLAFAYRGVKWAVEEADKPEFRLLIKNYLAVQAGHFENGGGI